LIAALEHPAIVPVYEAGTLPDGREFYAMKLIKGARLDHYLAAQPTLAERLRLIWRIGEALAYAHSHCVIHRDLKPQNVMVGEFGEVYVMGSKFLATNTRRNSPLPLSGCSFPSEQPS
jgi:serine/threonine protein kinase